MYYEIPDYQKIITLGLTMTRMDGSMCDYVFLTYETL